MHSFNSDLMSTAVSSGGRAAMELVPRFSSPHYSWNIFSLIEYSTAFSQAVNCVAEMESNSKRGLYPAAPKMEMIPPMTFHALPYVIFRCKVFLIKPIVVFHNVTKGSHS